jgi:hypothetical protein
MIRDLTEKGYRIAQSICPKDSLNLVLNGMRWRANDFVGDIDYDESIAPYLEILEDSTWKGKPISKKNVHKDYIKIDTVDAIKSMIYSTQNGQFDQEYGKQYQAASELKPTQRTNATLLKAIGGEALVSK